MDYQLQILEKTGDWEKRARFKVLQPGITWWKYPMHYPEGFKVRTCLLLSLSKRPLLINRFPAHFRPLMEKEYMHEMLYSHGGCPLYLYESRYYSREGFKLR